MTSSSILVVFHFGLRTFWSSSILVVFHFGRLPFWSSSILVVFHFGHLPFWVRSSFILDEVVFHFVCPAAQLNGPTLLHSSTVLPSRTAQWSYPPTQLNGCLQWGQRFVWPKNTGYGHTDHRP